MTSRRLGFDAGWRALGAACMLGGLLGATSTVAAAAPVGALTQLASPDDCITMLASGCGTVSAKGGFVQSVAVSPDGKNVYAAGGNSVSEFSRNPATGALTQLALPNDCITAGGSGCGTVGAPGMTSAAAVTVSPDNKNVYVAAFGTNSVAVFSRDLGTGALTQLASPNNCVTGNATGCGTVNATGMAAAFGVHVSADNKSVYVAGFNGNSIAEFSRDLGTGALTQLASPNDCITQNMSGCGTTGATGLSSPISITSTSAGDRVYSASGGGAATGAIAAFSRNLGTGALTQLASPNDCITAAATGCGRVNAARLDGPEDLAISPDGANIYVGTFGAQGNAVVSLARDSGTGGLTQLMAPNDCATFLATGCGANSAKGLNGAQGVAVSPDGSHVFATGSASDAVVEFSRNATIGALTQLPAPDDCITSLGGGCGTTGAKGLDAARRVAISPDGKFLYAVSPNSRAIAVFSVVQPPSASAPGPPAATPPVKCKKKKKKKKRAAPAACKKKKKKKK